MKTKIIGILVCTLVTAAAVLPAAGIMNISNTKPANSYIDSDTVLEQGIEDSSEIDEPDNPAPMPRCTLTGYLSIPPAAFTPRNHDTYFENKGFILYGDDDDPEFVAPVYLPHGATVTNITYYWINEAPASFRLYLYRNHMNGITDEMALVWVLDSGTGSSWTDEIDYADIDNSLYSYYIRTSLITDMGCYGVVIEYSYTRGSSSVSMDEGEESHALNAAVR